MTIPYLPERTIKYRTYVKQTLVQGLNTVFQNHPDTLLQRTRARLSFSKTEADYPCVVVKLFERNVSNAGVGHIEKVFTDGETAAVEVSATLTQRGSVSLSWSPTAHATAYKVYKGTAPNQEAQSFFITSTNFVDSGLTGNDDSPPTTVTAAIDPPQPSAVAGGDGNLAPGTWYYKVSALTPSQAVHYQHYFYSADVELSVYALSVYDRDLIADTLIQTIAMGTLLPYTNTFFDRVYPSNEQYPDADLHFINVNTDQIQGFGDSESETPWGAEDDLLYTTAYRIGLFGELYSLPPNLSYAMVLRVLGYPYVDGIDPLPAGLQPDDAPWVSNY